MAINFPTSLDNFTNPSSGNTLDSPSHSLQHSDLNDAVEALERKVGVGTAVAGSAFAGQVLTISAAGTSTWSTPTTPGLVQVVATSVAVGSGSGSVDANGRVTFNGASTVSINGIFTSIYENYLIVFNTLHSSNSELNFRLRASGTDSSANYEWQRLRATSTTVAGAYSAPGSFQLSVEASGTSYILGSFLLFDPFKASATYYTLGTNYVTNSATIGIAGGRHNVGTSYDGLTFIPSAGNITGTISIYGVR